MFKLAVFELLLLAATSRRFTSQLQFIQHRQPRHNPGIHLDITGQVLANNRVGVFARRGVCQFSTQQAHNSRGFTFRVPR